MDARRVFAVWRKILRDQEFQNRFLSPDGMEYVTGLGLDSEEQEILTAFHEQREAAYWPCEGYRYRSISSAVQTLRAYAPLTSRLLSVHEVAPRPLAERFMNASEWCDDGLNFRRAADKFLTFIDSHASGLAHIPYLTDAVSFDRTLNALFRQAATIPRRDWLAATPPPTLDDTRCYAQSPLTRSVVVEHALSAWLEQPERVGELELANERQCMLMQLLPDDENPDCLVVDEDDHTVYLALARPMSVTQVSGVLGDEELARAIMDDLVQADIIRPVRSERI